jgi:anaerobic selenocysteine-containing dehydrogenase
VEGMFPNLTAEVERFSGSALASGMLSDEGLVRGACPHDCPDRCAWVVRVEEGVALSLVGDRDHPETRGVLSAKVDHYVERAYSSLRVLHPLRRVGAKGAGSFERVSWEEALDEITGRVSAIVVESGATAILGSDARGSAQLPPTTTA